MFHEMMLKALFSKYSAAWAIPFCVARMKNSHDCFFSAAALKSQPSRYLY
jgi:hypothetical protein